MLGKLLDGRYEILQVLGAGGFGETYLAKDTRRPGDPMCVVKHLKPVTTDPNFLPTARRLFHSEAETLERLGTHRQIPRLLAYFEENQQFYLVQDYIPGHNLTQELILGESWSEKKVVELLEEVLPILKFVHSQGVIHRDVKPDNLLRCEADNRLYLLDFGAVKLLSTDADNAYKNNDTVAIGTPGYMPTEQGRGQPRPNSDIYALGVIAIQALTGINPSEFLYDSRTGEIQWQHLAQTSPKLTRILTKMVRSDFRERYLSVSGALEALAKLPENTTTPPPIPPTQAPAAVNSPAAKVGYAEPVIPLSQKQTVAIGSPIRSVAKPLAQGNQGTMALNPNQKQMPLLRLGAFFLILFSAAFGLTFAIRGSMAWLQEQGKEEETVAQIEPQTCQVTARLLNVRSSAGGEVVEQVKRGTSLALTGSQLDSWLEIKQPFKGWVSESYVNCDLAGVPSPEAKPKQEEETKPKPTPQPESEAENKPRQPPVRESVKKPEPEPRVTPSPAPPPPPPAETPKNNQPRVLAEALRKYRAGDVAAAVALAESIASNSRDYRNAQANLRLWRDELKSSVVFQKAQQSFNQGRWDDVLAHLNSYYPDSREWQLRFRKLASQARQSRRQERVNERSTPPETKPSVTPSAAPEVSKEPKSSESPQPPQAEEAAPVEGKTLAQEEQATESAEESPADDSLLKFPKPEQKKSPEDSE